MKIGINGRGIERADPLELQQVTYPHLTEPMRPKTLVVPATKEAPSGKVEAH